MDINIYLHIFSYVGYVDPRISKALNKHTAEYPYRKVLAGRITPNSNRKDVHDFLFSVCTELYNAFHSADNMFIRPAKACFPMFNIFYKKRFDVLVNTIPHYRRCMCKVCVFDVNYDEPDTPGGPDGLDGPLTKELAAVRGKYADGDLADEYPTVGYRFKVKYTMEYEKTAMILPGKLLAIVTKLTAKWPVLKARALARMLSFVRSFVGGPAVYRANNDRARYPQEYDAPLAHRFWKWRYDVIGFTERVCGSSSDDACLLAMFSTENIRCPDSEWRDKCVQVQAAYPDNKEIVIGYCTSFVDNGCVETTGAAFVKSLFTVAQLELLEQMLKDGLPSGLKVKCIDGILRVL